MSLVDLLIVAFFFIAVFLIGIIERKKITIDDYWVNSRKTNKFVLVATTLSTFIGAAAILGLAGVAYSGAGLATFMFVLSFVFYAWVFAKFFAPKIKEFGDKHQAYSALDFLEFKYSKKVRLIAALIILLSYSLWLALQMVGIGAFTSSISGFDPMMATLIGGVLIVAYTTVGGLRADIRTDIFQFFIMFFLLLLLPMFIARAGGLNPVFNLPRAFLVGEQFASWYVFIFGFLFLGATNLASFDLWQRAYAGDSSKNVRWAMLVSGVLIFFFLSMATLFGIYGKLLLPDIGSNAVIPELIKLILPAGLYGLVLSGFFAAILSTADTILLIISMTLVYDLYQKTFDKKLSPKNLLILSRWTTFIVGIIALIIAVIVFNIVHLVIEAVSFAVVFIPAIVFGFYWKKVTSQAALWSIIMGFLTIIAFLFIDPVQAFIPGLIVSFATFLIVNFLTKKS